MIVPSKKLQQLYYLENKFLARHNHTLFTLHILTYCDFLRILLFLEICIVIEEVDVGNIYIYTRI